MLAHNRAVSLADLAQSGLDTVSETFTIDAIDYKSRIVSLRDKDGVVEDVYCPPEVKRRDRRRYGSADRIPA